MDKQSPDLYAFETGRPVAKEPNWISWSMQLVLKSVSCRRCHSLQMQLRWVYIWSLILFFFSSVVAAPPSPRPIQNSHLSDPLSSVKTHLTDLKHRLNGLEQSVQSLKEQINNQDTSLLHFREEMGQDLKESRQESFLRCTDVEAQFSSFKSSIQSVVDDLGTVRARINELINTTKEQQERIFNLENAIKIQSGQIKLLESALTSLTRLLQGRSGISSASGESLKTHCVQPGDTLEKISKQYKVSVDAIREANQLKDLDKIRVNQILKIP